MKPTVMIILDGAGDVPTCVAYGRSPLAAARTPGLDQLTTVGHAGLLYPIGPGIEPETHSGMLNLLGYPLKPDQVPRGPIEALGCGLAVGDGDLVLRVNFGTRDEETGLITDRRVCRSLTVSESETLCRDLVAGLRMEGVPYDVQMQVLREYRGCAVIHSREGRLSDRISNTDPGYPTEHGCVRRAAAYEPCSCYPLDETEMARSTAATVNDFVHRAEAILASHEVNSRRRLAAVPLANCILTRGPGCGLPNIEPILSRFGLQFTLLADLPIERGVGKLVGCEVRPYQPGPDRRASYESLQAEILKTTMDDQVTVVHIKGPDEYGHDGDFDGKVSCIEDIDGTVLDPLVAAIGDDAILIVTSDHATPCYAGTHTADPVPFVVAGPAVTRNGGKEFSEAACADLVSPVVEGAQLLPFAISAGQA